MREIVQTIKVFSIKELDAKAQQKALYDLRESLDFPFHGDWLESVEAFCAFFRVKLLDYRVGDYSRTSYKTTELENRLFRGKKLKDFNPDHMPTGFCGDFPLWNTFHEVFKNTGDAKHAFKTALDTGFEAWGQDYEDYYSDESIIEHAECNDYEFTENGKFYI